ncbi:integrase arm-type DNA-binding domain-containing protein [Vibrio metschnikovii]|uniref:Integrase arm-type DNA-binding domain-containing protein n=1 Tax=bacterium 19PA01SH03 TaxID=2920705 RepID=A0AAU6SP84_UNCXX|nr:integrase arm-type DNA-binding domain-containing protein [Vibrio metschnikovii]EKO3683598.1 integrase arm-type DNA-binding domain-containing protein [Vibrio metschnikovii]EKO3739414.1 integrase arm-type DNA-binding domain-containing protein [Vibrio metschnikovii]EKO3873005.1 integrase arm-type DNA-binding domain-containing protein [Vibrio metschnikovii]EKO3882743.1 integrase arm-type DNA-binding domain-containing protein [Vibrio metschnikovii]
MAKIKLTDAGIKRLTTPEKTKDVYDSEVAGLVLRLQPTGTRSWSYTYRLKGKAKRLTIGKYPAVGLKLAREQGRQIRAELDRGGDPVEDRKAAEREKQTYSFEACANKFVEIYCKPNLRSWKTIERTLERFAIPEWRGKAAKDIKRRDVVELIDKVASKTPGQSNHLRAYLSKMYVWLIEREIVETNPVLGVTKRHKVVARDRVLSDEELVALWRVTESEGSVFSQCIRFLMLTGCRRDEASFLSWTEVDGQFASLPAIRMKAGKDFRIALSTKAQAVLESMPAKGNYIFTTTGDKPISGWGKAKARIDRLMEEHMGEQIPNWCLHDLRRTAATNMAKLGIRQEVIKRVLGHAASTNDVTLIHYLWHNYDQEALKAVNMWAKYIEQKIS